MSETIQLLNQLQKAKPTCEYETLRQDGKILVLISDTRKDAYEREVVTLPTTHRGRSCRTINDVFKAELEEAMSWN